MGDIEQYLHFYYTGEINPKHKPNILTYILTEYNLLRKDGMIIRISDVDE